VARALMEAGANAKAFTYKGENTLHFAAAGGDLKLVELLLKKKVNPRAVGPLNPKPYTLYPIPYDLYPISYTLYPIPYTLYPKLSSPRHAPHNAPVLARRVIHHTVYRCSPRHPPRVGLSHVVSRLKRLYSTRRAVCTLNPKTLNPET